MIITPPSFSAPPAQDIVAPDVKKASHITFIGSPTASIAPSASAARAATLAVARNRISNKSAPFYELNIRGRVAFLYHNEPFALVCAIGAGPVGLYLMFRAINETIGWMSSAAAQQPAVQAVGPVFISGSSRDAFDWYVGFLMGFVLVVSTIAIFVARNSKKIDIAKEFSKTIVWFGVGFLGGGKGGIR